MAIRANRYAERAERSAGEATRAAADAQKALHPRPQPHAAPGPSRPDRRQHAGSALIDQKDSARGMLWLVHAMELDPEDASGIHHAARVNLLQTARDQLAVPRLTLQPAGLEAGRTRESLERMGAKRRVQSRRPDPGDRARVGPGAVVEHGGWSRASSPARAQRIDQGSGVQSGWPSALGGSWARKSQLSTWDVGSGRQVGAAVDFPGVISAFRPDGQAIAVHLGSNAVRVFDRVTGKPLGPHSGRSETQERIFSRSHSAPMAGAWPAANRTIPNTASAGRRLAWDVGKRKAAVRDR